MTGQDRIHPAALLLWLMLFAGLPALVACWEAQPHRIDRQRPAMVRAARDGGPATPPPPVEPVKIYALDTDQARAFNAAVAFFKGANPAARPYVFVGSETDLARATDCLASAEIFEAGDDAIGERAVAQVVLNRVRHPAFPKTVCGVVFQGQERTTGCQFTFSCDGALARTPSAGAWDRAREIAKGALAGNIFKSVGYATHYHTDWVVPYWSASLDKVAMVGTHLFFRWRGWWGTPAAFRRSGDGGEPLIGRIARFSSAHQGGPEGLPASAPAFQTDALAQLAGRPPRAIGTEMLGKTVGEARVVGIATAAQTFLVELPRKSDANGWPALAQDFCAGRQVCRIMAWRAGQAPASFPLSAPQMEAMTFAYIHNVSSGLQRVLWNCAQTPRTNAAECMRQRTPVAAPTQATPVAPELKGVRRKERFETVTIAPVARPPASAAPAPAPADPAHPAAP